MAFLVTEEIIAETETELTIRFTSRGRIHERVVKKIEGKTNEEMLKRWHRRMTIMTLQNRVRYKKPAVESNE